MYVYIYLYVCKVSNIERRLLTNTKGPIRCNWVAPFLLKIQFYIRMESPSWTDKRYERVFHGLHVPSRLP